MQFLRYAVVGVVVMSFDYAGFLLGLKLGLAAVSSNAIGKLGATVVGSVLHRYYTFAGPQRLGMRRQMISYVTLSAANLALSSILVYFLVTVFGLMALPSKILTDVVVIAVAYLVSKLVIYAPTRP